MTEKKKWVNKKMGHPNARISKEYNVVFYPQTTFISFLRFYPVSFNFPLFY